MPLVNTQDLYYVNNIFRTLTIWLYFIRVLCGKLCELFGSEVRECRVFSTCNIILHVHMHAQCDVNLRSCTCVCLWECLCVCREACFKCCGCEGIRESARERRSRDNYYHLRGRAKESDTKRRPMTSGNLWGPATASILFLSDCSCLVLVSVCVAQRLRARFLLSDSTRCLAKTCVRIARWSHTCL